MTNSSIFTRVLALMICLVMLAGTLTACFQEVGHENHTGTPNDNGISVYPQKPNTPNDGEGNNGSEAPVDPNELFSASTTLSANALIYGTLANSLMIGSPELGAILPADVKIEAGAQNLALSVKNVEENNVDFGDAELVKSLDVHINGVAADNTVPMIVNLGSVLEAGLGDTELKLYHIENGAPVLMTRVESVTDFAIHNQYVYDAETGNVTIYVASFSVFTAIVTQPDDWDGTSDTSWYNENDIEFTLTTAEQFAGFRDLVDGGNTFAGKTVKLGTDIDLKDKVFDPIGFGYAHKDGQVFMGTFDGGNHTVYNLYENGWELDPDKTNYGTYTYSTAGAGLFASIKDATIKNIAINGAEIVFECVDMGVLVGYAQGTCHFENIVITNANIANYNRYTGGLVGEVSYGPYGTDTTKGYSHTFKNITIDSSVTVSGLWGSFGCGMGGVIGGKWGDATVKMENVVSAPVMDVYNDVVSAYQWYAFRGCGMLIGHTEEPYSDGRHSGIATAGFLKCENVKVYYGDWVNYTYYQFTNQDVAWQNNYPWVRAEAGEYCEAFSNIRYGVPTVGGVKVTGENADTLATSSTKIVFNQLYGADRGMYGQAEHEGVTVINKNIKTIYIQNNLGWENLKLHYWYKHGDDTWTNVDNNGVALTEVNGVYKVDLPAYAFGFRITDDGENKTRDFYLSEVEENETYNLDFEHVHYFADNKCDCGAVKQLLEHEFTLGEDGEAKHSDGGNAVTTYEENSFTLTLEGLSSVYGNASDAMGYSCIKLGTGSLTGGFSFTVPEEVEKVIIYVAGYKGNNATIDINGVQHEITTLSNNGEYTAIEVDTSETKTVSLTTVEVNGESRCMINTIVFVTSRVIEVHDCDENAEIPAVDATCTETGLTAGKACSVCGKVMVEQTTVPATGHTEETIPAVDATCIKNGSTEGTRCSVCEATLVEPQTVPATGHSYVDGTCENCGEAFPTTAGTYTYVFANYTEGVQYAKGEEHKLDENVTITTYDCHFTEDLRIYSSSTNNGYAIIHSVNPISEIGVNAGNKVDTINIYGSNDGVNWTEEPIATISVTSTSYKDYTVELQGEYKYIKLDVAGGNQVRIKSMTLTTVPDCAHASTKTETVAPTCTEAGYTVTKCASCGKEMGDRIPGDAATGHDYNGVQTTAPTCLTVGEMTYTCSKCTDSYTEEIAALGHTTDNGICGNCGEQIGGTVEPEPETPSISNKYYIATVRSSGNYWYMTSNLGTASTKRYTAVDSGLTTLPISITSPEKGYVFVLVDNGDNTYSMYAEGVEGNNYLGWTSGNSGILVAQNSAIKFTLDLNKGYYNIHFAASDAERYLALNGTSGNNYFAWYKSGQKQDLILIPVEDDNNGGSQGGETPESPCEHTNTTTTTVDATCTEAGSTTVTCKDCGETVSTEVIEATGHTTDNGVCDNCGETIGGASGTEKMPTTKYSFSSYSAGTQYAQGEEHQLDENTKLTINGAHLNTQIRLYSGSNCVFEFSKTVETIIVNAGNKAGTLTVYVSNDDSTWTKVQSITTTTSYTEYSVDLNGSYQYVKLESSGAQIRVSILTVNP